MNVSVVIPTYNSARTIRATLDSVIAQSSRPHEILVLDDGSTDSTVAILESYGESLRLLRQGNRGVASARNALCAEASGDLIAFLDHDDIWHPDYLQVQQSHFAAHPDAVAFFAGHINFYGYDDFDWSQEPPQAVVEELISPSSFLTRYNTTSAIFGSASFLCVPRNVLARIGREPFRFSGVDDSYLSTWFPLLGSVCYSATPLVAYRIIEQAQSTDKLKAYELWVNVFESFDSRYEAQGSAELRKTFRSAFASKRRHYAKRLMSAGEYGVARHQLRLSVADFRDPTSVAKSLGLLAASFLPGRLQPRWPPASRPWQDPRAS